MSSTVTLTEEERASLIKGSVFTPKENTVVEYQPYEVVRYAYVNNDSIKDIKETSSGNNIKDPVTEAIDSNTVSVESSAASFSNAIVQYNFVDGKIYDVIKSPGHVTDIRLAPGETISGNAAIGDSESWQLETAVSSEKGRSTTHIYVKPVTLGIETSIIIPTDQRTYYINLRSFDNLHMVGVRWSYPGIAMFGGTISTTSGEAALEISFDIDPEKINFNYSISGKNNIWKPTAVFDDGVHTYIQFDPGFNSTAGAPALYLLPSSLSSSSKAEVVNYVIQGNMYITDFVLQDKQVWYLMNESTTVKIKKK